MRWMFVVAALVLVGCSKGRDAEDRYRIVVRSGSSADQCEAARETAQGYLADKNDEQYRKWMQQADKDCAIARLQDLS